ncbi:aspartate aminotransferase family protein [Acidocella facilis]|uniref:aspartate aminotransferase family protein n=1 Tax=Acidocella facilis TaxID=525 RepID=UPI001F3BE7C9|nr:aspartate aminotransferase family protein [Acidocella facilis]
MTDAPPSASGPNTGMVNAFSAQDAALLPAADAALVARRQAALGAAYRLFYRTPVHPVRGLGCSLWDAEGNEYLDVYNNVASVGHCHPHVVAALTAQAATLNTHTRYLHETILTYAERLLATLPAEIGRAMFTCTGSEANDLAMRIARHATGGSGIVVTELAYHGVTEAVAAFSPSLGKGSPLGAHVRTVPAPSGENPGPRFAANVAAAFADLARHGIRPAALIVDTIFSSDGVYADPPGFLAAAVEAARAAGALFIADEVQAGFGRTGDGMWGFARHGVVPDIVTCGKPMGNGHPMAGLFAKPALADAFGQAMRYFNTFGGNPVSCAVGMAVLDVIERDGLIAKARSTGALLMKGLRGLGARHGEIGEVRGAGLFIGLALRDARTGAPSAEVAAKIVNGLRDRRILISATGPDANVLKIRPPLVFGPAEAGRLLSAMDEILRG